MLRQRAQVLAFPPPLLAGESTAEAQQASHAQHLALNAEDGTLHLLRSGFLLAGVAALAMVLVLYALGGISAEGPRSSLGWLLMMIALMSLPFGLLLLLLGGAKWLRNHWLSRMPQALAGASSQSGPAR